MVFRARMASLSPNPDAPSTDALGRASVDTASLVESLGRSFDELALVYLFGSATGDTARPESDLDVAFLADASPAAMARFAVQEDLARALGRDVDLVDLRAASTVMVAEVLRTGRLLFERSRAERDRFEMHTCSAYALLNEERRDILDDIRRRGSVYGSVYEPRSDSSTATAAAMPSDVVLNKTATIERCLRRVREEYAGDPARLTDDITRQDAIILNLQRACQASIDLATHLVRLRGLGAPQTSRDAFEMLVDDGVLDETLGTRLARMVGFRNVAIHDYQPLNLDIVQAIITDHLGDFDAFAERALRLEDDDALDGEGP